MQTPDPYAPPTAAPPAPARGEPWPARTDGIWASGERLTWVAGLVLALSAFMGWYDGEAEGVGTLSVTGWNTGWAGIVVFFLGLAVLALVALREAGIALPASVPESLVVIALGAIATIVVLLRLLSIPEDFLPADGRAVGIWISLLAAIGVIAAGLLQASEELT
jgi:hypothetical protein